VPMCWKDFVVGATKKAMPSALISAWTERIANTKETEKDCTVFLRC
jgi:hypothetical protein